MQRDFFSIDHHHHHHHLFISQNTTLSSTLSSFLLGLPKWSPSTYPWIPPIQDVKQALSCHHPHILSKSSYSLTSHPPPPPFYWQIPYHPPYPFIHGIYHPHPYLSSTYLSSMVSATVSSTVSSTEPYHPHRYPIIHTTLQMPNPPQSATPHHIQIQVVSDSSFIGLLNLHFCQWKCNLILWLSGIPVMFWEK